MVQRVLRRFRYGEPVIVVSGLPRSGTSMAMKMLVAGGLEVVADGAREADEDNPKGYFELEQVKDLDKGGDLAWVRSARGKAVKVISFLLKDLPRDNFYKVLFMRRNLDEVLASQRKMLDRRGEVSNTPDEEMKASYVDHLRKIEVQIRLRPWLESIDVPYRDVISSPRDAATTMRRFLDRKLDVEAMESVVDSSLYRNRR